MIDANAETVKILRDGLYLTVSIDRCVRDPKSDGDSTKKQQQPVRDLRTDSNENNQGNSNESMHQQKNSNENNQNEQDFIVETNEVTENVYKEEHDPEPIMEFNSQNLSPPRRIIGHATDASGRRTYTIEFDDRVQGIQSEIGNIPQRLLEEYQRPQVNGTARPRGRPRLYNYEWQPK